jgi:hypothetical protein
MALTDENMVLPVQPMGYGNNNGGFGFGGDFAWVLLLLVLGGGWGGFGMGGFGGAAMAMDGGFGLYPWLNNSQNINDGFRDQMLNSNVTSIRDGVQGLSTQLCQCCGDMRYDMAQGINSVNSNLCNGINSVNSSIFGAQTAISQQMNANEIANLNRSYAEQAANTQGFTNVNSGIADLRYTVATEACADRAAVTTGVRDVIDNQNANTRQILDFLVQDRITALTSENQALKGQISQSEQNAYLINALRPAAEPAYLVANPYTGMYGTYGYNAMCGGPITNGFIG